VEEMTENLTGLRRAFRIPRVERPRVQLVYYFATRRHRDPDNYTGKFILDGLRHAGIIADDNSEVLQLPQPEFHVDRERPRTEILITEWRAENGNGETDPD
jgi:Holliday junction resolvase RusA-like endonuclease